MPLVRRAYVIGSGPNGLTAAIVLARAGIDTTVLEAEVSIGGATRSAELTLPGFVHDLGSAVHPLAAASPIFAEFPLARYGLEWIHAPLPLAHALPDRTAPYLERSLEGTCRAMGAAGAAYHRLAAPLVAHWKDILPDILAPLRWPRRPLLMARFGLLAMLPATTAQFFLRDPGAAALFAGIAAHSLLPLETPFSSAAGWLLALAAHTGGWPIPRGGAQSIANALAGYFRSLGGKIAVNTRVASLSELREAHLVLADVTPRQLLRIAGERLPPGYRRKLGSYRYGPGAFKMDWALRAPIPWIADACRRAGTVHVGGTLSEIARSEREAAKGQRSARPLVLLSQPSLFDASRAPPGKHVAWGYCHVPHGSETDMAEAIEDQIERAAPGFRNTVLARRSTSPRQLEEQNANLVGGDVGGGAYDVRQLFFRPSASLYATPLRGLYLCSSSTPPGGGVHGMCGFHAANFALRAVKAWGERPIG